MSEILFNNFMKKYNVSQELCNKYETILPEELIYLWKKYGLGSFMGGYLKMINPEEYQALLIDTYFRGCVSIPMFITAFGDVITWEENKYVRMIKYRNGLFKGMTSGFDFFLEDLQDEVFNDDYFDVSMYNDAIKIWGNIEFDECFGYVPLLGLGGSEKVQNLKKIKIKEYIEVIVQLVGQIGFY